MKLAAFGCLLALASASVFAAETKQKAPYLGPGQEKLGAEEYERVYKNYIQTTILLGYPVQKEKAPACDVAISTLFRQAGMFGYPVPGEALQIQRGVKTVKGEKIETYEAGGFLLQLLRAGNGAPSRLLLVNSASTKATRRLSQAAKKEMLTLVRDPATGLERLQGIPVGFPHPFLTEEGQGLYVKELRFNGKLEGCEPLGFQDNSWVGGFDLSDSRCTELQQDVDKVWNEKISPAEFAVNELKRMKDAAFKTAVTNGTKEPEAKALVEKFFVIPFTNEVNIVGSAMRNLAQCNLLALGRLGKPRVGGAAPAGGPSGSSGQESQSGGSAK